MQFGRTDVPLDRDASGPFLPWLVAFMVYLAILALTSAIAMNKVVVRWDRGLVGQMTVQIPPSVAGAPEDQQAARIEIVLGVLAETPGVTSASRLEASEIIALLEPWLGEGARDPDLPLPALIAVTVDPDAAVNLPALSRRLEIAAPGTTLDDHQRWLGKLLDLARSIELISAIVVVLVGLAAVITVVFVTRTGLAIHHPVIELLYLIGALDVYIARQFQLHALKLGAVGGLLGLILAVPTILFVAFLFDRVESGLLPNLSLSPLEWGLLVLVPVATTLVAMITARLTVLRTLARLP